jgi:hypothetical protein
MTHQEKVEYAINHLIALGVKERTATPLLFRLLWKYNVNIPPPHFIPFLSLTILMAIAWGVPVCLIFSLMKYGFSVPPLSSLVVGVLYSMLFGVSMGIYFSWSSYRLKLPRWKDYNGL